MKNYRTTILGLVMAIGLAVQPILDTGELDIKKDWIRLVIAAVIATAGFILKDPQFKNK